MVEKAKDSYSALTELRALLEELRQRPAGLSADDIKHHVAGAAMVSEEHSRRELAELSAKVVALQEETAGLKLYQHRLLEALGKVIDTLATHLARPRQVLRDETGKITGVH